MDLGAESILNAPQVVGAFAKVDASFLFSINSFVLSLIVLFVWVDY